jgi:hypothetical protein
LSESRVLKLPQPSQRYADVSELAAARRPRVEPRDVE